MKLSEEQTNILKGAFERFPNPDYHSEALRMVSDKTGLQEGFIKTWFEKRREALCKNMKTSDEEDIQILDGVPLNSEVSDPNPDFVELDEAPEDSSPLLVKTQSSNSHNALSKEDKAAEYDNLKIQMDNLKKQMLMMSQSLDQRDQQQPPVLPQVRYQQPQHHYQHQYLPYPAQEYNHGYHQPLSFPYNPYSPWHLPYPPPEFQIIFLNPPPVPRSKDIPRKDLPDDIIEEEATMCLSTKGVSKECEDLDEEANVEDEKCLKEIALEEPPCEKIPEKLEELVEIVDNFEKQVQEEIEKDNLKIDATPIKKRINEDVNKPESLRKRYRLPPTPYKVNTDENQREIVDKSIEESLEKAQQEIDEFEKMLDEVDPFDKETVSVNQGYNICKGTESKDPSATQSTEDEDDDVLDESVILESEIERKIETEDCSTDNVEEVQITLVEEPPLTVVDPPRAGSENLVTVTTTLDDKVASNLNLSFDEALNLTPVIEEQDVENVEAEPEAIEFLGEDAPSTSQQQSRPPIPFIVKQEPQEARKVGRRALANKARSGPYQKPASPIPPPLTTHAQSRQESGPSRPQQPLIRPQQQQPRQESLPSRPQQPLIQPHQQQPRLIKVSQPVKRPAAPLQHPILQQQQRRSAPLPVSSPQDHPPAYPDQNKTQRPPPRGQMNTPTPQAKRKPAIPGGRARTKSQRMQQPPVLPIGSGITVTKVVEPPAPPPPKQRPPAAARPELQRILGMRNLSVSINRN